MTRNTKILISILCVGALVLFFSPYRGLLGRFAPYLLLLLCPLIHVFMMGSHHGGGHHGNDKDIKKDTNE